MIKLKSIDINGFKEANRRVSVKFSSEPVTVIYGQNGCGKTTLLKIIDAIFNKNEEYLIEENVRNIELIYEEEGRDKKNIIRIKGKEVVWGDHIKDLTKKTSILFGVNRGVIQNMINPENYPDLLHLLKMIRNDFIHSERIPNRYLNEIEYLLYKPNRINPRYDENWTKNNHISVDLISISEIEEAIIKQYRAGQRATSDKVKNAFFNTISSAVDIEMEKKSDELPINFNERIDGKRPMLIALVEKLDKSSLQIKLLDFLKGKEATSELKDSKIFRALLLNILEKVEEESIELKSISHLISIFNAQLYRNKKMIISDEEAYIEYAHEKRHKLEKLSSGERHLLTFLTLFLIIGRNRDFFIIDEPEISLNMEWQHKLMPMLSELSPNSQIIVATHSPAISNRNSKYLVELV